MRGFCARTASQEVVNEESDAAKPAAISGVSHDVALGMGDTGFERGSLFPREMANSREGGAESGALTDLLNAVVGDPAVAWQQLGETEREGIRRIISGDQE